uniref:Uncharacterized protein n=1 Tax=Gibberella zeae (strain ATCC MYA-4620 / CBS 123657 / FGSC 9075 / NRRL 31084 / PH-1) TaxID=229533 RepID=A0A098DHA7_GIBZE
MIQGEHKDSITDRNSGLSWSYFARILHLEAVFEETLRCGGATSSLQHLSKIDTQILGYHIPKGTDVLFLAHGPSVFTPGFEIDESKRSQTCQAAGEKRDQDWDDHDIGAFKPERWLGQKESSTRTDTTEAAEELIHRPVHHWPLARARVVVLAKYWAVNN